MTSLTLKRASSSRPDGQWSDEDYDELADGKVGGRILEEGSRFGPPDSMGLVNHLDRAGDTGCDERHRRDPGTSDGEVSVGVGSAGGSVIARWDFFLSPANGTLLTGGDPFLQLARRWGRVSERRPAGDRCRARVKSVQGRRPPQLRLPSQRRR